MKLCKHVFFMSLAVLIGPILGGQAWAGFVDFDAHPGAGHSPSISYAGGIAPLIGSDLFVDSVLGESTPLHDGTMLTVNARLDFTTGNLVAMTASTWEFGPGGSFTIFGTVPGLVNAPSNLFSGTFSGDSTVVDLGPSGFKVIASGVTGTLNSSVAAEYGMPTSGTYLGGVSLLFQGSGDPPKGFTDTNLNSGNIAFTAPEPGSWVLLCLGALGVAFWRKRLAWAVNRH